MWPTEKGALYSVIIVDVNIERVLPKGFFHWAVINIPGNRIEDGNEVRNCKFFTFICTLQVMEYVPPFHFKLNEDGSLVKDPKESASPMLVLVFKQVRPWKLSKSKKIITLVVNRKVASGQRKPTLAATPRSLRECSTTGSWLRNTTLKWSPATSSRF